LQAGNLAPKGVPILCTTFGDFTRNFGGFSDNTAHNNLALAHGVYGFFNNGGTRAWVMRYPSLMDLHDPENLTPFEPIDEISLVVAPGIADPVVQANIVDHCANMADRFAILDGKDLDPALENATPENISLAHDSDYAAVYYPMIKVFDKATQLHDPTGDGEAYFYPSGHIAGIYSRVDHERGVYKAPANEVIRGATGLKVQISRNLQDGLNPKGVNCIRFINDNITVWGARTIGGDINADLKYINVRRTLIFIRKSIDEGTQWVVFEPNDRTLWAKIVRNVTAFLTIVWRDGALFGSTPQEAFYVKCDDETNPPEDRDIGRVTTEIGVAIVRPAEFVIFRISQWGGPQAQ
jgi:phage tail sheath protein FI